MTGKEILLRTLKSEPAERIPWVPFVGVHGGQFVGAAYVDFVAIGRKQGWLNAMGRFVDAGVEPARIHLAGNGSLAGASLALLHPEGSRSWPTLCQGIEIVELNQTESFEDHYLDAMRISAGE